jgi:hypothetical protein
MKHWSWILLLGAGCTAAPAQAPGHIPPIDAEAPRRVETATFALG